MSDCAMATSRLGRIVRAKREERGWSRATLARKSGVSEPTIARVELYGHDCRPKNLHALARALGVEPDELLNPPAIRPPTDEKAS